MTPAPVRPDTRRITLLLALGAVGIGVLDTAQLRLGTSIRGGSEPLLTSIVSQGLPWVWLALLIPGVVWMTLRAPLDPDTWKRNLGPHLAAMVAFALLHIAGTVALGLIAIPSMSTAGYATKVLLFRFPIDAMAYWGAVGAVQAARAMALARTRERAASRLEASLADARLAGLRDRLHPHFVFNTLNAVSTLALSGDHAGVIRTVEALGDLLRALLAEEQRQEISLGEELGYLDRYLEIERLRFGERLGLEREIDPALLEAQVPVLLIQPLVENAIRHGAARRPGPASVAVRAHRENGSLVLEVSDSGPGFSATREAGANGRDAGAAGIGLANCRARLDGLYGEDASLWCGDAPDGGGLVRVRLPYHETPLVPASAALTPAEGVAK